MAEARAKIEQSVIDKRGPNRSCKIAASTLSIEASIEDMLERAVAVAVQVARMKMPGRSVFDYRYPLGKSWLRSFQNISKKLYVVQGTPHLFYAIRYLPVRSRWLH